MAQLTANFALGTNGNAILAADPGSANAWDSIVKPGSGTGVYDNTHTTGHSPEMAQFVSANGQYQLQWSTALGTVTDHYGRLYWYQTGYGGFLDVVRMGSTGSFAGGLDVNITNGHINLRDQAGAIQAATTQAVALNQLVRIEWHIIHSATVGQIEVKLFNSAESTTPDETIATTANINTLASANEINFGPVAARAETWWIGDIVANANAYPGRFSPTVGAFQ
jgi:hypothetical protein